MDSKDIKDQYYRCNYCKFRLPIQNYNLLDHSCFANMDVEKETLYVNEKNILYKGPSVEKECTQQTCDTDSCDISYNNEEMFHDKTLTAGKKKKGIGKENNVWKNLDEKLIQAVQERPCLWNHQLQVKCRSTYNVKELWEQVKKDLNVTCDILNIKKRWKHLRDCYVKDKQKRNIYIPSGSAASFSNKEEELQGFRFYKQMQFLNDTLETRQTVSNIDSDNNENTESIIQYETKSPIMTDKRAPFTEINNFKEHLKRRKTESADIHFKEDLLKIISENTKAPDGVEGTLIQLGDVLRRLPYNHRRQLELKMLNMAFEVEQELGLI